MLQIPILDVIIAVVFVYFLFSMLATLIVESLNQFFNTRGRFLFIALQEILGDEILKKLYDSPNIQSLGKQPSPASPKKQPMYISAASFTMVIMDYVIEEGKNARQTLPAGKTPDNYDYFLWGIDAIGKKAEANIFVKWLKAFVTNSENIQSLHANIQKWYEEYMNRLGGWYKANASRLLFYVAIPIVVIFNIDAIRLTQSVVHDDKLRETLMQGAMQTVQKPMPNTKATTSSDSLAEDIHNKIALASETYQTIRNEQLPIGWSVGEKKILPLAHKIPMWRHILFTALGWIISIFIIQKGAPFWYDILKGLVNLRGGGKQPLAG